MVNIMRRSLATAVYVSQVVRGIEKVDRLGSLGEIYVGAETRHAQSTSM